MKKRILLRLGFLTVIAAAGFVLIVWWTGPTNRIDAESFARIQGGMTEAELVEILKAPSTSDSILRGAKRKLSDVEAVSFGAPDISGGVKEWRTLDGRAIAVAFDENGKVSFAARFRLNENWLDKVRRWLRLS